MQPNPIIGVLFHWMGGLSSASFYVPYRGVKRWSWEIFWLTGGIFSWVIAPWVFASVQTNDLLGVISAAPRRTVELCVLFGILWGFGGLTYGLTMRYLGLSLGMAVVLGLSTIFGTLIPPIFAGEWQSKLLGTVSGRISLFGLAITLIGIIVVAIAGARKDAALSAEQKATAIAEFDFRKGLAVAIFSGIMSSCYAYGLAAGEPVRVLSAHAGTGPLWVGLPVICLVTAGGLVTNGVWCAFLILRNASFGEWFGRPGPAADADGGRPPLARNFLLCALGGTLWYFQFFFYTMGESQMGRFGFSSWTLHMASIIIFGTVWGFVLREWRDAAPKVKATVWSGVALLILATVVIGYGNMLGA
jgi:L-rhamnose-H+ transport protein